MDLIKLKKKNQKDNIRAFLILLAITGGCLVWDLKTSHIKKVGYRGEYGSESGIVLLMFFALTIWQLVKTIQENQRFRNYQQIYDMKRIQHQLNNNPKIFYFSNKPILYITDDYIIYCIISCYMGIRIEERKNIYKIEENIKEKSSSRYNKSSRYIYSIVVRTVGGRKNDIVRTCSRPNDKEWEEIKKLYRDIDTYLTMDKYYNVKNEEMESY